LKAKLEEASDRHRKELENLERFHREEINDLQASFAQQQKEKVEQLKTEYLKNIGNFCGHGVASPLPQL